MKFNPGGWLVRVLFVLVIAGGAQCALAQESDSAAALIAAASGGDLAALQAALAAGADPDVSESPALSHE